MSIKQNPNFLKGTNTDWYFRKLLQGRNYVFTVSYTDLLAEIVHEKLAFLNKSISFHHWLFILLLTKVDNLKSWLTYEHCGNKAKSCEKSFHVGQTIITLKIKLSEIGKNERVHCISNYIENKIYILKYLLPYKSSSG